jgi:hypothetical protein
MLVCSPHQASLSLLTYLHLLPHLHLRLLLHHFTLENQVTVIGALKAFTSYRCQVLHHPRIAHQGTFKETFATCQTFHHYSISFRDLSCFASTSPIVAFIVEVASTTAEVVAIKITAVASSTVEQSASQHHLHPLHYLNHHLDPP